MVVSSPRNALITSLPVPIELVVVIKRQAPATNTEVDLAGSNMDPVVESRGRITANSVRPHATEVVAGHLARTDVVNLR